LVKRSANLRRESTCMKNLAYLNKYLWKYRGRLTMGIVFIVLGNIFNVYAPIVVGQGIDFLVEMLKINQLAEPTASIALPPALQFVSSLFVPTASIWQIPQAEVYGLSLRVALYLGLIYLGLFLVKGVFLFYQRQTIIVMSRRIEYDLKNEIYEKYQDLDSGFYKANRTGDMMNRISEDVNRVRMYLGPAIMYTINLVVLVVMCIAVMWGIDRELTLYTLMPLPFMMILIFYVSTVINRRTEQVQRQQSKLSTLVQETMAGIRVIKAFGKEKFYGDRFKSESDDYKALQLKLVKGDALFMPVITLLVGLSTILTIYIGAGKVMEGDITVGVIVQFVFYVNQLTWPFASVGWVTSLVQKAEAAQKRINAFLAVKSRIQNSENAVVIAPREVTLSDVSFTYPESGIEALRGLHIEIPAGKNIAIVGATGSGKSSIAQLILRMYDPTNGRLLIQSHDLREVDMYAWRSQIGFVPQDVFLFSDTIAHNIAFGLDDATQEAIEEAAKMAGIHEEIIRFENGYNTLLGERGINLSGGQKQRISIARALIKKPSFLILDDCLSAVDTATEDWILSQYQEKLKGTTMVTFAHRLSTIRHAEYIYVLHQGEIAEQGTHLELLQMGGRYASMHQQQLDKSPQG
jgi:ATP-binding cassette, subfamily B, multidrug efflux pump